MKNLKKVLALALVAIMALATMATASAAFTDEAAIVNKDAANLLTQVGIITGGTDGAFNPTGKVTRGQMAAMIYRALNGGKDDGAYLYAGLASVVKFKDVSAANWDRNYIYYAHAMGIISGGTKDANGYSNFAPDAGVTGYAAAKMLLVALGYDADVEGYLGSEWEINALLDANAAGLFKGLTGDLSRELTKDEAALMIANAMDAEVVVYLDLYPGVALPAGETFAEKYFSLQTLRGVVVANEYADIDSANPGNDKTVIYDYVNDIEVIVPVETSLALLGRDVEISYKAEEALNADATLKAADLYGTVILTGKDTVYTVNLDTAAKTGNAAGVVTGTAAEPTYYYAAKKSVTADFALYNYDAVTESLDELRANRQVELVIVVNTDAEVTIAFYNEFAYGTVQDKVVDTTTAANSTATIGGVAYKKANILGLSYDALEKDAKIFYQVVGSNVYVKDATNRVTGKMTAVTADNGIIINGTTYYISNTPGTVADFATIAADNTLFNTDLLVYTDGKYIVDLGKKPTGSGSTGTTINATTFAGVNGTKFEAGSAATIWEEAVAPTAKISLTGIDGKTYIYNVNAIANGSAVYSITDKDITNFASAITSMPKGIFIKYTVRADGAVDLKVIELGKDGVAEGLVDLGYTEGAPVASNNKFVTDATTFFIYDTTNEKFVTLTGRADTSIVATGSKNDVVVLTKLFADNDTIKLALMHRTEDQIVADQIVYGGVSGMVVAAPTILNDGKGYYQTIKVFTGKEVVEVKTAIGVGLTSYVSDVALYNMIECEMEDGVATDLDVEILANIPTMVVGNVQNVGTDFIVAKIAGTDGIMMLADKAEFYDLAADGTVTATTLKAAAYKDDTKNAVIFVIDGNGEIAMIIYTADAIANVK